VGIFEPLDPALARHPDKSRAAEPAARAVSDRAQDHAVKGQFEMQF
jgi:hypothetical protein